MIQSLPKKIKMDSITADIMAIIEDTGYDCIAIRKQHATAIIGDILPHSYVWEDNNQTDDELPGTSALVIGNAYATRTVAQVKKALENVMCYPGETLVLVGGALSNSGEDIGEVIITDAVVLAAWTL